MKGKSRAKQRCSPHVLQTLHSAPLLRERVPGIFAQRRTVAPWCVLWGCQPHNVSKEAPRNQTVMSIRSQPFCNLLF